MKVGLSCLILLSSTVLVFGCAGEKKPSQETSRDLAAKVDDWTVDKSQIEDVIAKLPPKQKEQFDSPGGRAEIADRFIEEELFFREGKRVGLEKDEEVRAKIDDAIRRILIAEYYNKYIEEAALPDEEEMHEHYELNKERYTSEEVVRAQHIFSTDREKLVKLKERIENGEKMTDLARKYSEDRLSKAEGGDLGYFNRGGYVRFVGRSRDFSDAVFALEPNVVSDPIKYERGYSIVMVREKRPPRLRPYDEVRDEIARTLRMQRINLVKEDVVEELKKRYEYENYYEKDLELLRRSPEELWNLAQESTDPYQRLRSYEEIVRRYPESDYAPQALFMIGFVYAEELSDRLLADRAFRLVLSNYPESDVSKSAEWMLKNLDKPLPEFRDIDELQKKISEESK